MVFTIILAGLIMDRSNRRRYETSFLAEKDIAAFIYVARAYAKFLGERDINPKRAPGLETEAYRFEKSPLRIKLEHYAYGDESVEIDYKGKIVLDAHELVQIPSTQNKTVNVNSRRFEIMEIHPGLWIRNLNELADEPDARNALGLACREEITRHLALLPYLRSISERS